MTLYGAVEGGGTKFLCALATAPEPGAIVDQARFDTVDAESTLAEVGRFFRQRGRLAGLGVASFGPLELDPARALIETDVNAAALGEQRWGAGRGADPLLYVTVGTGIGGGAIVDGRPLHGLLHPEMGHVPVPAARLPDGTLDP